MIFLVYVILIGPITKHLVDRLRKPIYGWVMIPAWILLMLIIMGVFLNSSLGNAFPMVHDIAYISMNGEGLPARVIQGSGVTAPQSRQLSWMAPGQVRALWGRFTSDVWDYTGQPYPFTLHPQDKHTGVHIPKTDGMMTFATEGIIAGASMEADLQLTFENALPRIDGTLNSELPLLDASFIWVSKPNYIIKLTDIMTPFIPLPVSAILTPYPEYESPLSHVCGTQLDYREPMIAPVQISGEESKITSKCYIVGKLDYVPFPNTTIAGSYIGESCVIYKTACPVQPPGIYQIKLMGQMRENQKGWIDPGTDYVTPNPTSSDFTYVLPQHIQIKEVTGISVAVRTDNSEIQLLIENETLTFMLFDFQAGTWAPLIMHKGFEDRTFIAELRSPDVERFYNPDDRNILIHIEIPENT
ncbi:MAG: hypothetical protein P1S60_20790, partial [Anaerolineae bacterium]|nr:hypothetical protein [Anaerolineae bacterium]